MARDRKRAKQRQQRRAKAGTLPRPAEPRHENIPGSLEHASGDVQEFDAALIAGAGGQAAASEPSSTRGEVDEFEAGSRPDAGAGEVEPDDSEFDDAELESAALANAPAGTGGAAVAGGAAATARRGASTPAAGSGENRVLSFLRASWSELQRVQWPDRRAVAQATGVVLGFVVIAGAYLGLADLVASKIVDAIL